MARDENKNHFTGKSIRTLCLSEMTWNVCDEDDKKNEMLVDNFNIEQ